MQTQITKEHFHWWLALGLAKPEERLYTKRDTPFEIIRHEPKAQKIETLEIKTNINRNKFDTSGLRQLDRDIRRIKESIRKYLLEGNYEADPQVSYKILMLSGSLFYSSGKVMLYESFYQHLRRARKESGLPVNMEKFKADRVVSLFDSGKSIDEIVTNTGTEERSIYRILIRYNRKCMKKKVTFIKKNVIPEYFKEGKSVSEISELVQSRTSYVYEVLRSNNLLTA